MARKQVLDFGSIKLDKVDENLDPLYFLSGKHLYEIGAQSGDYPPLGWRRPGFLVGKSIMIHGPAGREDQAAHLLNEMGGIWAHPIKVLDGFHFGITDENETWLLKDCQEFVYHLASADFIFEHNDVEVVRTDFVVEDAPALFSLVRIRNNREHAAKLKLHLTTTVNLMPAWFAGLRDGEDIVFYDNGKAIAYDSKWPENWAVVFGGNTRPDHHKIDEFEGKKRVSFTYSVNLNAGEEILMPFLFVAENQRGYPEAVRRFDVLIGQGQRLLEEKVSGYRERVFSGVHFECSDPWQNLAFYTAKANLVMLMAEITTIGRPIDMPAGRYLYAGIPEYVQFFGTDTAYSIPGLMVVDYWDFARDALLALARYGALLCGRIPHEITTGGRIFHPGNTQETPQYTIAAWNYFKWTGDRVFLEEVYPICALGVADYVPAHWDTDLDYYPDGNGVVERVGMGSEKLDSICYFTRALFCLAEMADTLGYVEEAKVYRDRAKDLKEAINADWWIEDEEMYADSLKDDHSQQLDGHWTVTVPMETGMSPRDRAARSLERIRREWVNQYGMVHTKDKEDFVWTLPTGVLAMAEFAYGDHDTATRLLRNITETIEHGTLGAYKELIPEGLSFMQLWSPAMYLQGLIEGVFGLYPWADDDYIEVSPKVSTEWKYAKVENLHIGEHRISIFYDRTDGEKTSVEYLSGRGRFKCRLKLPITSRLPIVYKNGKEESFSYRYETNPELPTRRYAVIDFELDPFQRVDVKCQRSQIKVEILSTRELAEAKGLD